MFLSQLLSHVRRVLVARLTLHRDASWAIGWYTVLLAIELVGRSSDGWWVDVAAIGALVALAAATWVADRERAIAWWRRGIDLARGAGTRAVRIWGECGVDLRSVAGPADGVPRPRVCVLLGIAALIGAVAVASPALPGALPEVGRRSSYSIYVVAVAVLVAAAGLALLGLAFLAAGVFGDARLRAADNQRRPRPAGTPSSSALFGVGFGSLAAAWVAVPVGIAIVGIGGGLLTIVGISAVPRFRVAPVIWRGASSVPLRTISLGAHLRSEIALVVALLLLLVTVTTGLDVGEEPAGVVLPVLQVLGRAAAWSGLAAIVAIAWRFGTLVRVARRDDAAATVRPVRLPIGAPAAARSAVERLGFSVRDPAAAADPAEVFLDPLAHDPETPAGRAWLLRRHELIQRRLCRRGLRRLLRSAARFDFEQGAGFWIGPHLWMMFGLARDEEERESMEKGTGVFDQVLGPDHVHAIPASARAYFRRALAAVQVDLLFVEDGVRWPALQRVLVVIYEVLDIHAGRRRVEDHDFVGLPGVRVMLHELEVDNPLRAKDYPEPDYEGIARARVLHVFRDRGGETSTIDVPSPGDRVPLSV